MGKKIVLAIFGGIALVGLLLMITGFALGGRVTNMSAENGRVVLNTGSEKIDAGAAPRWMTDLSSLVYWADHHVAYESGTAYAPGTLQEDVATATESAVASAAAAPEGAAVPLPFSKADVKKIDIDIGAGYVMGLLKIGQKTYESRGDAR